ncbi:unnamed protein product [Owenia fusiformis]|uniref:Uncharacterized protein n=1 Tax=Owenia fusiformis TaxID=6347 RepID=A0A8J1UG79_OWEFU|nr:unnamed protein product [Owenia fusiformis]
MLQKLIHLLILVNCLIKATGGDKEVLTIGGLFPNVDKFTSKFREALVAAADIAVYDVNNAPDVLPSHTLVLQKKATEGKEAQTVDALYEYLNYAQYNGSMIIAVAGPFYSNPTIAIAPLTGRWGIVQVGYGATSPKLAYRKGNPFFFRTSGSDGAFNSFRLKLLNEFNWKKVATLTQLTEPLLTVGSRMQLTLDNNNIEVIAAKDFYNISHLSNVVKDINESDSRIILADLFTSSQVQAYCEAYKLDMYGPNYLWISVGPEFSNLDNSLGKVKGCTSKEVKTSAEGSFLLYHQTSHLDMDQKTALGSTRNEFFAKLKEKVPDYDTLWTANMYLGQVYDSVVAIALALDAVEKDSKGSLGAFKYHDIEMATKIKNKMEDRAFEGMSGPIEFDENGDKMSVMELYQVVDGKRVGKGSMKLDENKIKWYDNTQSLWKSKSGRAPKDGDQVSRNVMLISKPLHIVLSIIAALTTVLATVSIVMEWTHRKAFETPSYSMHVLNVCMCLGAFFLCVGVIRDGFSINSISDANGLYNCKVVIWLYSIGATLLLSAMVVRMGLTYTIHTKSVSERQAEAVPLMIMIGCLLLSFIIVGTWIHMDPLTLRQETKYEKYDIVTETIQQDVCFRCSSSKQYYILMGMFFYLGILLFFASFFSWPAIISSKNYFSDVNYLAISVFVCLFLSVVGAPLSVLVTINPTVTYGVSGGFILAGSLATVLLNIIAKVVIRKERVNKHKLTFAVQPLGAVINPITTHKQFGDTAGTGLMEA